jgi:hypothetical protein
MYLTHVVASALIRLDFLNVKTLVHTLFNMLRYFQIRVEINFYDSFNRWWK